MSHLAAWITRFAVIRAVVSVSALGTWAAVSSYPMVSGDIIAAGHVADAMRNAVHLNNKRFLVLFFKKERPCLNLL